MARTRGFAVRLTILLGVVLGTLVAPGPSASADGPGAIFLGFVVADPGGALPTRVRAVGTGGAVCGTADVSESGEGVGFYIIRVAAAAEKAGCPTEGETVRFILLHGNIDDGSFANGNGDARFRATQTMVLHLAPASSLAEVTGWSGARPPSGGVALLTWAGPENTPVDQAVQTLGIPVAGVWHLPPGSQRFLSYIPGAPAFAQTYTAVHTGQIVVVRAR